MIVRYVHECPEYAEPLMRAAPFMHGIEVIEGDGDCDCLLIHSPLVKPDTLNRKGRTIIHMQSDEAGLGHARGWLSKVAGVIKGYCYRPASLNNECASRYHSRLLIEAGFQSSNPGWFTSRPKIQLSEEELSRLRLGYGFGGYCRLHPLTAADVDFDAPRAYSLHFAGWLDYQSSEIEQHRRLAFAVASRWSADHPGKAIVLPGRALPYELYTATMRDSLCVLSPWGWGEACHRDYEAILCGAILVKPDCSHVDCWPQIYVPWQTYVPCRPDFADLAEVIEQIESEWPDWRERRKYARALVVEAARPESIGRRLGAEIASLVSQES